MTIQFVQDPVGALQKQIARLERDANLFAKLLPVLAKFEGKKPSKRLQTALEKALPEYTFYLSDPYSWTTLKVWGNGILLKEALSINVGYQNEQVSLANIKERHPYYTGQAFQKADDMRAMIPGLLQKVEAIKEAQAAVENLYTSLGEARYYISETV